MSNGEEQYAFLDFEAREREIAEALSKGLWHPATPLFPPGYEPRVADSGYGLAHKMVLMCDESQRPLHFANISKVAAYARLHQVGILTPELIQRYIA